MMLRFFILGALWPLPSKHGCRDTALIAVYGNRIMMGVGAGFM